MKNDGLGTTEFSLAYDGEALADNTMDVRDLAPSLIAMGELFTRANTILNGESVSVSLKVRATKPGSFELLLVLAAISQSTTQFLTSDMVTSASNLVGLIIGVPKVGTSLFKVYKKLQGQKPTVIQQANGVTLKATNIELFVPTDVFRLYQDENIKNLSQAVVEPLFREGVEKIIFKKGATPIDTIEKDDAQNFTSDNLATAEGTENVTPRLALRLVSPSFNKNNTKWKLDDGGGAKWYTIQDAKFFKEVVEHKRRFGYGDYLICRVKTIQKVTQEGIEIDRIIISVLEQKKAGEQSPLSGFELGQD